MHYGRNMRQQPGQQPSPVISTSLSLGTVYARPVPSQPNNQQAPAPPAINSQQAVLSNEAHQGLALSRVIWSAMRSWDGSIAPDVMAQALATGLPQAYILNVARATREQEAARHLAMQRQGNAALYYLPWQPQSSPSQLPSPSQYHQSYQQGWAQVPAASPPNAAAASSDHRLLAIKSAVDNLDEGRRKLLLQAVRSAAQSSNGIVAPEAMNRALACGLSQPFILNTVQEYFRQKALRQQQQQSSPLVPRSRAPSNPTPSASASSVPAPSARAPSNQVLPTTRTSPKDAPSASTPLVSLSSARARSNPVPPARASSMPLPDPVASGLFISRGNEGVRANHVSCQGGAVRQEDSKTPARGDRKRASSASFAPTESNAKHARRKQRRGSAAAMQELATFNGVIGIEGIGHLILGFVDFRTLHLVRVNTELLQLSSEVMESSALRVTAADVAVGAHVQKLRHLVKSAKPGQTIRLAGGEYMLGDESVSGHARRTIVYDTDGELNGGDCGYGMYSDYSYSGDCYWNEWESGYGPIKISTPGIKLIGPSGASEEPAIFVFNATYYWSEDPVAIHVDTKGITIANVSIRGPCEAVHVGREYYDEEQNGMLFNHGSVFVENCQIQGSVCILEKSKARVLGCRIYDHTPFIDEEGMKAAVSVGFGASLHLERTSIVNSRERHPTVDSRLAQLGSTMGGLYVGGRAYLKDVSITGNFPAGLVMSGKVLLGPRVNIADNWGEPTACAKHPDLKHKRFFTPCCGNVCFIDKENALEEFHEYFQCDGSRESLVSLGKVVQLVLEQTNE